MTMTDHDDRTARPARPAGGGVPGWARWAWRTLTSMRTALILLFLFALASVPGSIFPQRSVSPAKVAQYFTDSPEAARWLDRLWLFDVFQAPWFAAIYLLLFVSLVGCVIPRTGAHLRELRRRPPDPPRNLSRLPYHATFEAGTTTAPSASEAPSGARVEVAVGSAARLLRKRRFRVVTGPGWVAAEKGHLRETGNLLFHVALLGVLLAVGLGALYGYRGNVLVIEGKGFANTVAAYDRYIPGSQVAAESLEPFSFHLTDFTATYILAGERRGQPLDYAAKLTVEDFPGASPRDYTLKVNEPLDVNGTQTYLLDHGFAPSFRVTGGDGEVAFDGEVPCIGADVATRTSECVIKVPDARPEQLGFLARFLPTTVRMADGSYGSAFPAAVNPSVELWAFSGDLGLDSGAPQSVFDLGADRHKLKPLLMQSAPLEVGESLELPDGAGKVTFTGIKEWISLQIAYDPGRLPALIACVLAVTGLVLSLTIRRRRVWVRVADPASGGGTVVEVGGLTRTEGGGAAFAEEFADIVTALRGGPRDRPATPVKE